MMSLTPEASNDPIPISLPERLSHLSHDVTPGMEPLVSLLQNLAKAAPSAIRNKHKLYSIILRAGEICNHLLAIGAGPEPVGLESLDEYCNLIDLLEEHLLRTAGLLVAEQGLLSPELCSSWSETRAGLVEIMDGLHKSPFTFDRSNLEDELAKNILFDDCYWFSFLLHEGIEKEFGLRFSPPEAVAAVKESLGYLEREIKHGRLNETVRGSAINIASSLYENMAALDATSSDPQDEPAFIPASQDALIKELFDAFSTLNLESFPETRGPQKLVETELIIAKPPSTESSGLADVGRQPVNPAPPLPPPTDMPTEPPRSFGAESRTNTAMPYEGGGPHFYMALSNKLQKEGKNYYTTEYPLNMKANEDWVVTITVNETEYTAGPMKKKSAAREAAAEKALRGLGWF